MQLLDLSEAKAAIKWQPVTESDGAQPMTVREASRLLAAIPEVLEAFGTQAQIELALDDRGWITGMQAETFDLPPQERKTTMTLARRYWQKDPLAKQAVRLWTDYSFGATGLCYECDDEKSKTALDAIFKHPINKQLLNAEGQQRSSKKLLTDGDLFFAVYDTGDVKQVRYLPTSQIERIITNPDDEEQVVGFRRMTSDNKKLYYQNWTNQYADEVGDFDPKSVKDPDTKDEIVWQENVVVYHAAFDKMDTWGNGILNSCIDWFKEHRRFMQARVALLQALLQFAFKADVKGGATQVAKLQDFLQSSITATGLNAGPEKNPASPPGSTWIQNAGTNLTPMPRTTGSGDAKSDGDMLKLMVCAGTGIMQHYFGDPSTGNLASTKSMELPMRKQFEGYQQLWKDIYRDLMTIFLDEETDKPIDIEITLPPITDEDLGPLGTFMTAITTAFPESKIPEVLSICLKYLGVEDVDATMEEVKKQKAENDAKQAEIAKAGATVPQPGQTPEQQKQATATMQKLAESIAELNSKL